MSEPDSILPQIFHVSFSRANYPPGLGYPAGDLDRFVVPSILQLVYSRLEMTRVSCVFLVRCVVKHRYTVQSGSIITEEPNSPAPTAQTLAPLAHSWNRHCGSAHRPSPALSVHRSPSTTHVTPSRSRAYNRIFSTAARCGLLILPRSSVSVMNLAAKKLLGVGLLSLGTFFASADTSNLISEINAPVDWRDGDGGCVAGEQRE